MLKKTLAQYFISVFTVMTLCISGCVFPAGNETENDFDVDVESLPIKFLEMSFARVDTVIAFRLVEAAGKIYVTNGKNVFQSSNHGQTWRKLGGLTGDENFRLEYAFRVEDQLYIRTNNDTAYQLTNDDWHGVFHNYALPSNSNESNVNYSISAGGRDYVCTRSQLYFAYGACGEVYQDADTLKFLQISSPDPSSRGHYVSGDSLYIMYSSVIYYVQPSGLPGWAMNIPNGLVGSERFAFLDSALFVTGNSGLWKVAGDRVKLIYELNYVDDGINDPGLSDNGYRVLKRVGLNVLFTGAGTQLSYLHAGSEVPVRIPFFDDKHVYDIHVSGGSIIMATRQGIYRAKIKT